jgi:hypothetical protein
MIGNSPIRSLGFCKMVPIVTSESVPPFTERLCDVKVGGDAQGRR